MKKSITWRGFSAYQLWSQLPRLETSNLPDVVMFGAGIALLYSVITVGRTWFGPFTPAVEISRSLSSLPAYAGYSLLRITIAYLLSLAFTLVYGYVAAYNPRAERFMIPLLDVLQSIPVLSFLPGVMLAMVALFPGRQLGVELGAILLIFTGQVWNMAFSFYSSLKSIPKDMREAATIYRFSWWQRFTQMELPFSAIGLVWNSMMSVAGGWFALMVCEMFVLGPRDFRLPGLGSYLQTAASAGDTTSILWGIATMVAVIVLLDQFIWRPVIAWAEKFKVEQVESTDAPRSWVLNLVQHSTGLAELRQKTLRPLSENLLLYFANKHTEEVPQHDEPAPWREWLLRIVAVVVLLGIGYGVVRVAIILSGVGKTELHEAALGLGATFLRVNLALLIGALWTIPAGVAIGFNPRLARIAQPLAQIAASVPATALAACNPAGADPNRRRTRPRIDCGLATGYAMVCLVQRDRGRDGDPNRFEGMLLGVSNARHRALEETDPARNFSLSSHRTGDGLRRRMECQHRGRVLSFQRPDLHHDGAGCDHQPGHRQRRFPPALGRDHDDGGHRGDD